MELEFDEWWKDFEFKHKGDKDGGREALKDLRIEVGRFSAEKRIHFIDEIIKRNKNLIASDLIELYGNTDHKKFIREKFREWLNSEPDVLTGGVYVRTVLRTFYPSDLDLIRFYFRKSRGYKVPFELYDIDKSLFLQAFELLLQEFDDESIYHYDGLLYLTKRLDIIEFLIDNLSLTQSKRIQQFCRSKSTHSVIDTDKWRDELLTLANKIR